MLDLSMLSKNNWNYALWSC